MLTHLDGALLVTTHLRASDPGATRLWEQLVAVTAAAGLDQDRARSAVDTVFAFTNGYAEEQARDGFPQRPDVRPGRYAGSAAGSP